MSECVCSRAIVIGLQFLLFVAPTALLIRSAWKSWVEEIDDPKGEKCDEVGLSVSQQRFHLQEVASLRSEIEIKIQELEKTFRFWAGGIGAAWGWYFTLAPRAEYYMNLFPIIPTIVSGLAFLTLRNQHEFVRKQG